MYRTKKIEKNNLKQLFSDENNKRRNILSQCNEIIVWVSFYSWIPYVIKLTIWTQTKNCKFRKKNRIFEIFIFRLLVLLMANNNFVFPQLHRFEFEIRSKTVESVNDVVYGLVKLKMNLQKRGFFVEFNASIHIIDTIHFSMHNFWLICNLIKMNQENTKKQITLKNNQSFDLWMNMI